ncbi:hypothetical protein SO802_012005 [Lithocarpus litseifolius]|uniref:Uncharacterized protein n=1 Tax=Lithocarpus litseifolius TaxID=425828 RepID=A0AAW2D2X3_9ROSI
MAVSELIDPELHVWRGDMIMTLFHRDDAVAITKIPLSKRDVADSIVWLHNKNGKFSVKEAESAIHALWNCAAVQDVWAGSIAKLQKGVTGFSNFMQLMEHLVDQLSTEEMELFWVQCCLIWNQHNCILYGGKLKHPTSLNKRAEEFLEEFKHAQVSLDGRLREQRIDDAWQPPPSMEYKLNFDAAIFSGQEKSGIGSIIRNDKGKVMAAQIMDNLYIDCNDEDVNYVEAKVKCSLSEFLESPTLSELNKFLPFELDEVNELPAVIQVTFFNCGGLAIGVLMSHRIVDALSFDDA